MVTTSEEEAAPPCHMHGEGPKAWGSSWRRRIGAHLLHGLNSVNLYGAHSHHMCSPQQKYKDTRHQNRESVGLLLFNVGAVPRTHAVPRTQGWTPRVAVPSDGTAAGG